MRLASLLIVLILVFSGYARAQHANLKMGVFCNTADQLQILAEQIVVNGKSVEEAITNINTNPSRNNCSYANLLASENLIRTISLKGEKWDIVELNVEAIVGGASVFAPNTKRYGLRRSNGFDV
jgi:hypothetical protein